MKQRLKRQLPQLNRIPALIQAYSTARNHLGTVAYWSQTEGNQPPATTALAELRQTPDVLQYQRDLMAVHLKMDRLHRTQKNAWTQQIQRLEAQLQHNHLLDPARAHADQDRASRTMLSLLRNRHAGRRAFIIGNGPSLRIPDLDRLQGEVTFASNKIYLAYEETRWRPTYYSVEDHLVLQNNRGRIHDLEGSIKIFPANVRDFGFHAADTIFVPFRPPRSFEDPLSDPNFPDFSSDLSHGICWGSTIVYSQIQMAIHMGCCEIYLIGLDHSYQLPRVKHGNQYLHEGEQNHFHPEYRVLGERWHQPNLEVLEASYGRARDCCAALGVPIFNASRKTCLDAFERFDFNDLFNEPE